MGQLSTSDAPDIVADFDVLDAVCGEHAGDVLLT
jgi:hypothetical protein